MMIRPPRKNVVVKGLEGKEGMAMANVQLDMALFIQMLDYFFGDANTDADAAQIKEQLMNKLDKLVARELFTNYKTAPTAKEREDARQKYLAERGILPPNNN